MILQMTACLEVNMCWKISVYWKMYFVKRVSSDMNAEVILKRRFVATKVINMQ